MRDRFTRWAKRTVVALFVILPPGAAGVFLALEASSQPRFCGSCHIMEPYYESWRHSTHSQVACVECHIPPGAQSVLRKKYEAISMVAKYVTGTYGTKPWAEIDDQSCLRSGCHAKRVLLGRELYQGVLFDHQPHLTEMRRSKQLRCTSCHSQIVQGSHIAVTPSSCFLCHFKGTPLNEGTGRCTICHAVPERVITTGGLNFDHGDVKRFGMDCRSCHQGVVKGDGEAPRERCFNCHNDVKRLERYPDTEFLHRMHVTDHKVECLQCHIEITHKVPAREELVATGCQSCHSPNAGHSASRDLYRGVGARGVEPQAAAMFLAGVHCEACHNQPQGDHLAANEVSCMSCHGASYLTIYRSWQAGLGDQVRALREEVRTAVPVLEAQGGPEAKQVAADAQANLALLDQGHAIHNPGYARAIIRKTHDDLAAARRGAGEEVSATLPWVEAPYQIECLRCHFGVEQLSGTAFGRQFPHQPHTVKARLRCTTCHGDLDNHGAITLDASRCDECHTKITTPMTGLSGDECLRCHVAEIGPVSEKVKFPHEKHVAAGFDCEMCHEGVADKPHREFARSPSALPKLEHKFCATCHSDNSPDENDVPPDNADCDFCHVAF